MVTNRPTQNARLATLSELIKTVVPLYLTPVPCKRTLASWLNAAGVARLKCNPAAKRGGGLVYYHVGQVEKALRRLTPGRLTSPANLSAE
jgi:hypothetical protein